LASDAGALVAETGDLELLGPPSLGVVCFRYRPRDPDWTPVRIHILNEAIQARVIQSGTAMISSTRLRGTYSLRLCIMSHQTTWDDVSETIGRIAQFGRALSAAPSA
jgi:aromatic-L-amino-acid decarboxylase